MIVKLIQLVSRDVRMDQVIPFNPEFYAFEDANEYNRRGRIFYQFLNHMDTAVFQSPNLTELTIRHVCLKACVVPVMEISQN